MFSKSKPQSSPSNSAQPASGSGGMAKKMPPSIVATNMRVLGDLETEGDVQIDGQVDGNLRTRIVTIGADAVVNGAIDGATIRIAGTVNGEIRGGAVFLAATARVVGDIHHDTLSIDAGAFVQGLCKRTDDATDAILPPAEIPKKPVSA